MRLEEIGFYTLSDERARNVSKKSPLWRCEMILTGLCNFKCPYCRGSRTDEDLPLDKAKRILDFWISEGLKNIRFSGGEPTLYKGLKDLVEYSKKGRIERIAISTNGSAEPSFYKELISLGVNDFSISLDACCASYGDKISGVDGSWKRVVYNIIELSKLTYVTVGLVFTEETHKDLADIIRYASSLGVSDVRVISSAQYNAPISQKINQIELDKHPILKYRLSNFDKGRSVRGIKETDCHKCHLVKDDMAIEGDFHYPCIIHLRETKKPIGKIGKGMREERFAWFKEHNSFNDEVCRKNCLDVCVDYNNKVEELSNDK